MSVIKRNYKDSTFRKLFNDKDRIIELYNALSGSNYGNDTNVEIITLDNAIMGDRKNDLAFRIEGKFIVLIEHQSSINPNMPLRTLIYLAREYENNYFGKDIYSKTKINLPTPEIYVFYNGVEDTKTVETLKLSDLYIQKCDKISLEVKVEVININHEKGAEILKKSKSLNDYSLLIHTIRQKENSGKNLEEAIEENATIKQIRKKLAEIYGQNEANGVIIQYGGSVKASNAKELFEMSDIDGGLVGGASLKVEEFANIVNYNK